MGTIRVPERSRKMPCPSPSFTRQGHPLEGLLRPHRGFVHENVDAAEFLRGGVGHFLDGGGVGDMR